jgi:hypothetical protein
MLYTTGHAVFTIPAASALSVKCTMFWSHRIALHLVSTYGARAGELH